MSKKSKKEKELDAVRAQIAKQGRTRFKRSAVPVDKMIAFIRLKRRESDLEEELQQEAERKKANADQTK